MHRSQRLKGGCLARSNQASSPVISAPDLAAETHPHLIAYVARMMQRYYPDHVWDAAKPTPQH
jgi:hypothetical protein